MDYTAISNAQQEKMLRAIGVDSIDALFDVVPDESRLDRALELPKGVSELELQRELRTLADANNGAADLACFMGAGAYDHFIPAFIDQMISRGEFLTAYTPYQAEASQGTLQAFFEFQSQIVRLTGMDVANASLYDGATACVEAVNLAINANGKRRVLVASTLHPDALRTLRTHLADLPAELIELPAGENGLVSPAVVSEFADNDTACLLLASPNFFGLLEDWTACFKALKNASDKGKEPLAVAVVNPTACAILKTPGECGADVACGEGQPLGVPLQFGGPYLGLFAAKKALLRKMPGRLISIGKDAAGRRSYALALQTREQHIRGAKATSNICTNQGLLALRATMYMTAMGPDAMRQAAQQCWHKAHALAAKVRAVPGFSIRYPNSSFFHEFVVACPKPAQEIVDGAKTQGMLAGVALGSHRVGSMGEPNELMLAVTEKRTAAEIDALVEYLRNLA